MTALLDRIKARTGTGGGSLVDRIKVRASGGADPQEEVQGGLRFQLGLFGDTLEEQKATFKKAFPEGELVEMQVPVSPTGEISSYRGGSQEESLAREGQGVAFQRGSWGLWGSSWEPGVSFGPAGVDFEGVI